MSKLTQDLQDVIDKNLPAQVSGALQARLRELEHKETELEKLKPAYQDSLSTIRTLKTRIEGLEIHDRDKAKLDLDIQTLDYNKKVFEVNKQLKDLEVQYANQGKTDMFTLVSLLMKNPRAIELTSQQSYFDKNYTDPNGNYINEHNSQITNGTIEKTETKDDSNQQTL